ncbi:DUF5519 family protein [Nonomuraea sp. NN258]|uniref:luciferase domain-containing protein n=1 Tax=Nonomuraea antri TaxID=2730852 RepID=UPI00156A19E3|nr:luciferase family protein [Nonomuraea antri]NRQ40314.1 DUF5519 family protein [Nonomuraea antri]
MAGTSVRRWTVPHRGAYVARAEAALRSWPSLAVSDTRHGVSFAVRGTEILRLTGHDQVQIRLTAPAIGRLEPYLGECDQVRACPDRAWVCMRVDAQPDFDLLLALTSVAIKAHDA